MEEKSKRGEKPKNKAKRGDNTRNTGILILSLLFLIGLGLTIFFLLQPDPDQLAFERTRDAIQTENAIAMTQISASVTAAIENATNTATLEPTLNKTERFVETESVVRSTEIAGTVTQAYLIPIATQTAEMRNRQTATASVLNLPTSIPTTVSCGYTYYNGQIEVVSDSLAWQTALSSAGVQYQYAQVYYDVWEAQICGALITPLPYRCLSMEIALDIAAADWGNIETLVTRLTPILETIGETGLCDEADAELQVYFFVDEDLHYWWAERAAILEAYQNGASPENLWALGTFDERDN
jgi:hypothetical protein